MTRSELTAALRAAFYERLGWNPNGPPGKPIPWAEGWDAVAEEAERLLRMPAGWGNPPKCVVCDQLGADFEALPTGDQLREHWMAKLPEGERRILSIVADAYPKGVSRDAISEKTGYKRSSRDTYLQKLTARRLVVQGHEGILAAEELFS